MVSHSESPLTFDRRDVETTIQARFQTVVQAAGNRVALTGGGRSWTYAELNRAANGVAHAIRRGLRVGTEPVALLLPQGPEMVIATLAILKADRPYLALHPGLPRAAIGTILRDATSSLIVTNRALAATTRAAASPSCNILMLEDVPEGSLESPVSHAQPRDPAAVFFTSGTTGRSKGVIRSHRVALHRAWLTAEQEGIRSTDRRTLLGHFSFASSQVDFLGALMLGTTLCVFDVMASGLTEMGDWLDRERITVLRPPVQLFRRFVAGLDPHRVFPQVRVVGLGGDVVRPDDVEAWARHFVRPSVLIHRFSTTETTLSTITRLDHDSPRTPEQISAGWPVADRELTVVDQAGQPVPDGQVGELVVTSEFLADGYWQAPEETARVFTVDPTDPRRRSYRSGDVGRLLPDGRFVFLGRRDHLVKVRGYRVNVREVEDVLRAIDGVADAAIVAPQTASGTELAGFVVMCSGTAFDAAAIRERCRATLPDWKIPSWLSRLDVLPLGANGKLDRHALLQQAGRDTTESPGTPMEVDPLEAEVAGIIQDILGIPPLDRPADFFLLGGDSLQATVLHQRVEQQCGVRIPLQSLLHDATVAGIAAAVRAARAGTGPRPRHPVLVPLRSQGSRAPVFLVHGRLGQAFVSPHFLTVFGDDQPVYAFQATGLDWERMPVHSVPAMAAAYVEAMRRVQPEGPYVIVAACVGAIVAVEMAHQLRRENQAVAPLVFIDPPVASAGDRTALERLGQHVRWIVKRLAGRGRAPDERRLARRVAQGRIDLEAGAVEAAAEAVRWFERVRRAHRRWSYDGPVLMLRSTDRLRRDGPARRGRFSRHLTGPVRWFDVGGRHGDVRAPDNDRLATALREALAITRAASAASARSDRGRPL